MPAASRDELPEREIAPGYSARYEDWGGMTVSFETTSRGKMSEATAAATRNGAA